MRNLSRIEANLMTLGQSPLLREMLAGPLQGKREMNFGSLALAKRVQALLYDWLFFHPEIKKHVSLRLNTETATLYIMPRTSAEKRGRGKLTT